jgi:hypothetical protein
MVVCSRVPGIKTCRYQGCVTRITEQNLLAYENPAEHTYLRRTCTKKNQETESKSSGDSK